MAKCKCEHDWKPIFASATEANSQSVRMESIMMRRRVAVRTATQCVICGQCGWFSEGRTRTGVRRVYTCPMGEKPEQTWREAAEWNAKVAADARTKEALHNA